MRALIRPTVLLIVAGFATAYFVQYGDSFLEFARSAEPTHLFLATLCATGYWLTLALAWSKTQAALNGGLGVAAAVRIWSISTVARYVPGNIWHIAGRAVLAKDAGGDPVAVLSASAYEQVLTVLGALLLGGLFLPLAVVGLPGWIGLLLVPVVLGILHPRFIGPIIYRASALFGWPRPPVLAPIQTIKLLVWYALPNVAAGGALVLVARLGAAEFPPAIGAFAIAWSIGYLSILTPSGLGPRELALAALLSTQIGPQTAGNVAIGHRLVLTAAEFVVAISAAGAARFMRLNIKD